MIFSVINKWLNERVWTPRISISAFGAYNDGWIMTTPVATNSSARPRVLVTHNDTPQAAVDLLTTKCDVTIMSTAKPSEAELLRLIPGIDAVYGKVRIDVKALDAAGSNLKIISTPSGGYDHLDIDEIKKRGIRVAYIPKVLTDSVAEIGVLLLLNAARCSHEGRVLLEQGKFEYGFRFQWLLGHDLRNKTVGIVGLGHIGERIVRRLKPFKVKTFLYTGHSRKAIGDELGAEFVTFNELVTRSDFVVNCAPLTPETHNLFDAEAFNKMKTSCVFVNVGRGKSVDTEALTAALRNRTIFAAGLDVTDPEPLPTNHELFKLPNAVITPHMGSQTVETRNEMSIAAAQNVLNGLVGKPLYDEL